MLKGYRLIGLYYLTVIALLIWLCSCKSIEYVPIEVTKTVEVHHTDTVEKTVEKSNETHTILREARPEDSAMIAKLGIKLKDNEKLLILLQRKLTDTRNELKEIHSKDSVREDSAQAPVPVERKLSRFEQVCLDYGKLWMGGTAVAVVTFLVLIILWIRRRLLRLT